MSKGVKILLWVLAILAVLAVIVYFLVVPWGKKAWDNVTFSVPRIESWDLNGLNLNDLANIAFTGTEKPVDIRLGMDVMNKNSFSILFSNIKAQLFYNGIQIAETTDNASHTVPANGTLPLSSVVKVTLNATGGQLLLDKLVLGKTPVIDYIISANVFGIPIKNIKNNFKW